MAYLAIFQQNWQHKYWRAFAFDSFKVETRTPGLKSTHLDACHNVKTLANITLLYIYTSVAVFRHQWNKILHEHTKANGNKQTTGLCKSKCSGYSLQEQSLMLKYPQLPSSAYVQRVETGKQSGLWSGRDNLVCTEAGDCETIRTMK